jgi:DNA-directed RNA polymerase specialized sigma24 family protein
MPARNKPASEPPEPVEQTEAFLAWLEAVPDPRERYWRATKELERHQQAVERLSGVRAMAASDAYASGETVRALAKELGVSPARVHQLLQDAKARTETESGPTRRPSGRQKGGSK